jgi:Ca2+-binding RTX toxin-like protein
MFTGMNNLTGGTGADSFEILPGGSLSGNLNAGTGTGFNSLSYSQWTSGVSVNLSATTVANATAISGLVSNMQMVTGGLGNDTLIGQAAKSTILIGLDGNDTLTGGSQRDLLLGGSGIDKLSGAASDDLLVSGTTSYDGNRDALVAIHSEWISTRTFALRTANIWGNGTGTRNNGDFQLNSNPSDSITDTVFADSDVDSLTGGLNQDWFFASLDDTTDLTGGALPDRLDR